MLVKWVSATKVSDSVWLNLNTLNDQSKWPTVTKPYTLRKEFCYKIYKYAQVNQIYEYGNSACSGMFLCYNWHFLQSLKGPTDLSIYKVAE